MADQFAFLDAAPQQHRHAGTQRRSTLASEHQFQRLRTYYRGRVREFLADEQNQFDIYLLFVPRTGGDTYLRHLDRLAPELAAALLVQPSIAAVVRRVVAIRTDLQDDDTLRLQATWAKHGPDREVPLATPPKCISRGILRARMLC